MNTASKESMIYVGYPTASCPPKEIHRDPIHSETQRNTGLHWAPLGSPPVAPSQSTSERRMSQPQLATSQYITSLSP